MSDLLHACAGYALEPSELSAFRNLLLFQNTDISTRTLTTNGHDAFNFIVWIDRLSGCYKGAISAKHKAYYDRLFDKFCEEDDLAILHQMFYYCMFTMNVGIVREPWPGSDNWHGYWQAYRHGMNVGAKTIERISCFVIEPGVVIPTGPQSWKKKIENLLAAWGDNPPKKYIPGETFTRDIYAIQCELPDALRNCVNFPTVTKRITPLWDLQWQDLQALRAFDNLDNGAYFYLLHLLIGLSSGNNKMADYVARLARARTSTEAYPEETFINQLTYLVLMYLGDPNEPGEKYCLNNDGLRAMFNELKSIIHAVKPGANAIQQSIKKQLHQMDVLSFYPILDQETNIPLAERKAMTRSALLKTFKATPFEVADTLKSQPGLQREAAAEEPRMILRAPIVD
jgi:hypothetical protein